MEDIADLFKSQPQTEEKRTKIQRIGKKFKKRAMYNKPFNKDQNTNQKFLAPKKFISKPSFAPTTHPTRSLRSFRCRSYPNKQLQGKKPFPIQPKSNSLQQQINNKTCSRCRLRF